MKKRGNWPLVGQDVCIAGVVIHFYYETVNIEMFIIGTEIYYMNLTLGTYKVSCGR
ncbi:MAG: hypothetical protein J7L07_12355 [Candidatus Odinarchaeota archaeon]|nr:hypothetical protein [Candidatus Odinarchaeota archaeon]